MNLPGVDGIMLRGDGMHIDGPNSRNEEEQHRLWNMKDFTLVQTVGIFSPPWKIGKNVDPCRRDGNLWKSILG